MCSTKTCCFIMASFIVISIGAGAGLIPFILKFFESYKESIVQNGFSYDVINGLIMSQNQPLFDILSSSDESNRTLEQNLTILSETNSLLEQLNSKVSASLDPKIEKFYNIRIKPNSARSIDISYSIKTQPISKSDSISLKTKLTNLIKNSNLFSTIKLNNGVISINDDLLIQDPVEGELNSKKISLSSSLIAESVKKLKKSNSLNENKVSIEKNSLESKEIKNLQKNSMIESEIDPLLSSNQNNIDKLKLKSGLSYDKLKDYYNFFNQKYKFDNKKNNEKKLYSPNDDYMFIHPDGYRPPKYNPTTKYYSNLEDDVYLKKLPKYSTSTVPNKNYENLVTSSYEYSSLNEYSTYDYTASTTSTTISPDTTYEEVDYSSDSSYTNNTTMAYLKSSETVDNQEEESQIDENDNNMNKDAEYSNNNSDLFMSNEQEYINSNDQKQNLKIENLADQQSMKKLKNKHRHKQHKHKKLKHRKNKLKLKNNKLLNEIVELFNDLGNKNQLSVSNSSVLKDMSKIKSSSLVNSNNNLLQNTTSSSTTSTSTSSSTISISTNATNNKTSKDMIKIKSSSLINSNNNSLQNTTSTSTSTSSSTISISTNTTNNTTTTLSSSTISSTTLTSAKNEIQIQKIQTNLSNTSNLNDKNIRKDLEDSKASLANKTLEDRLQVKKSTILNSNIESNRTNSTQVRIKA